MLNQPKFLKKKKTIKLTEIYLMVGGNLYIINEL